MPFAKKRYIFCHCYCVSVRHVVAVPRTRRRASLRGIRLSFAEVQEFVECNDCVSNWLGRYGSGDEGWLSGNRLNNARVLCRFFKWLRIEANIELGPAELLNHQDKLRREGTIEERQRVLQLVLKHSRDNPDYAEYSDNHKYSIFQTVKSFFDYNEVQLTLAKNVYGRRKRKKNRRKQITLSEAKKLLGRLSQRDRTILIIMLHSGMEIGAVLKKFGYMWHTQVKPQLDMGKRRLKIELAERKGGGNWYFTYVSRDAIHELQKWLEERRNIIQSLLEDNKQVQESVIEGEPIFITRRGKALKTTQFAHQLQMKTNGEVTSHMFRKLFKSEASVPDRAISRKIVEFWMGHFNGIDAVGGEYDRNPEIHEEIFEKEYAKLEPFINIYSGSGAVAVQRTDPLMSDIEKLAQLPHGREFFQEIVADAKSKLSKMLNQHVE